MFVPIVAMDLELFRVASCVAVCGMVAVEGFRAYSLSYLNVCAIFFFRMLSVAP